MTTGILSVVAGSLLLVINRLFSESATLYFASFVIAIGIVISVTSYNQLGKRIVAKEIDADIDGVPDKTLGKIPTKELSLSPRNQARTIKSLFTFASSIRFVVGLMTIGIALTYRNEKFVLGLCFFIAAIAAFVMNTVAVQLNDSKIGNIWNYLTLLVVALGAFGVMTRSTILTYVIFSAILGAVSAYSRVTYESHIAHVVPSVASTKIISRGEVWLQLLWVVGATLAVFTYRPFTLGAFTILACSLSAWAYASTLIAMSRTKERF